MQEAMKWNFNSVAGKNIVLCKKEKHLLIESILRAIFFKSTCYMSKLGVSLVF